MNHVPASRWSLVAGRWSLVAGRWSLVAGRWSLVAGRWSLVAGRWSLVASSFDFFAAHDPVKAHVCARAPAIVVVADRHLVISSNSFGGLFHSGFGNLTALTYGLHALRWRLRRLALQRAVPIGSMVLAVYRYLAINNNGFSSTPTVIGRLTALRYVGSCTFQT